MMHPSRTPGFSRRALLAGAGALLVAPAVIRPARAAEFTMKCGGQLPAQHPESLRLQEAAENIRKASGGRLDIQVYPNNQLGGGSDMLSQVRSGALEFMTASPALLSSLNQTASINSIGFAFNDMATVWSAMDGELGAFVRGKLSGAGLYTFERIWDNGFRQVTSSTRPIEGPADFKGLKIRVPLSPLYVSMFKALGAAPASINFGEVYSALQTKVVEAQENPLPLIYTSRFYEVQKYCSLTNHMWDGEWLVTSKRTWGRLPADLQEVAAREFNAAAERERDDIAKLNTSLRDKLSEAGMAFNTPDVAPIRAALQASGFYNEWRAKYGEEGWGILEKYSGPLA